MLGHGFSPSIRRILANSAPAGGRPVYSATMEQSVASLVNDYTRGQCGIAMGSTLKPAESDSLKPRGAPIRKIGDRYSGSCCMRQKKDRPDLTGANKRARKDWPRLEGMVSRLPDSW